MDWNISKSTRRCSQCNKEFAESEIYFSILLDEPAGLVRQDFCSVCWTASSQPRANQLSFWKTEVPRADAPKKMFVDDAVIFDFFKRLEGEEEDAAKRNFRYILALMLMRKKLLKFKDVKRADGKEYIILRRSRTEEEHRVLNPSLTDEETEQVRIELSRILETEVA